MPIRRPPCLLALAAVLALAGGCAAARGDRVAEETARPTPPPLTMTPVRFDAYVLALRNIQAMHPTLVGPGGSPTVVREEMREAVGQAGLTLEEFRALHAQAEADPVLRAEAEFRAASLPPVPRSGARPPSP